MAVRVRHAPAFDRPLPSGVSQIGGLQKSSKGRPFSHPLHNEQRYSCDYSYKFVTLHKFSS